MRRARFVWTAALLLFAVPRGTRAWQTEVANTPPAGRPLAVAVDGAGDVVAGGRVDAGAADDGIVVKLGGLDGAELWQRRVTGSAGLADQVRAVTHDASNAVVAVGQTMNTGTNGDALVLKLDADGNQLWRLDLDGGAHLADDAQDAIVDGGDVVVAGQTTLAGATTPVMNVQKRAGADGGLVWHAELTGTPGVAHALVSLGPDLFVAGDAAGYGAVARLASADGAIAWQSTLTTSTARAIAIGAGRVVVAGRIATPSNGPDFAVVALDAATGNMAWAHTIDGSATGDADADDAFGVAIDANGDVVAVGRISDAVTDDDLVVMKLAGGTGDELWRTTVKGNNSNDDDAQAVALDAAGDALVVGSLRNMRRGRDMFVGKFAGTTGAEQWRLEIDGTESAADQGLAIALDAAGNPVAGGRLRNGAAGDGFTVVKLTGANGGDFPCANGTKDPGEGCDDGNVTPGDGCRADCTVEVCGDGIKDPQETCDDGNTADGDCCASTCTPEPDGNPCDDGNACTLGETCKSAVCTPASTVVCTPPGLCFDATCNPADGTCSSKPKVEGALCNDGDMCTALDRCIGGVCTGSIPPTCQDDDPCTVDRCDPALGCVADPRTGFESVTCILERDDIASACGASLPRPIQSAIGRVSQLLAKGASAKRVAQQRKALLLAKAAAKRGLRLTAKRLKHHDVTQACADALTRTLNDLAAQAVVVRGGLGRN